jgi:hypothetical protein
MLLLKFRRVKKKQDAKLKLVSGIETLQGAIYRKVGFFICIARLIKSVISLGSTMK